ARQCKPGCGERPAETNDTKRKRAENSPCEDRGCTAARGTHRSAWLSGYNGADPSEATRDSARGAARRLRGRGKGPRSGRLAPREQAAASGIRSRAEEHTSEFQSPCQLVSPLQVAKNGF